MIVWQLYTCLEDIRLWQITQFSEGEHRTPSIERYMVTVSSMGSCAPDRPPPRLGRIDLRCHSVDEEMSPVLSHLLHQVRKIGMALAQGVCCRNNCRALSEQWGEHPLLELAHEGCRGGLALSGLGGGQRWGVGVILLVSEALSIRGIEEKRILAGLERQIRRW